MSTLIPSLTPWLTDDGLRVFLVLTVIIGGGAAFLAGRGLARGWKPLWRVFFYMALLSAAVRERGGLVDEDIRAAAAATGLPEATVHGVATFYDDLLAPRGARHVRVCTGTACFAATGGGHEAAIAEGSTMVRVGSAIFAGD